MNKDD